MKIAFVGHAAVGKDTLSDYSSVKLGFTNISSGNIVRDYIIKNKKGGLDRDNVRKVANELRAAHGGDYLIRKALEMESNKLIISELRALDEVVAFKAKGGVVIAVTASPERRYKLAQLRSREGDMITFEEWKHQEEKLYSNADTRMQNVDAVIALADYVIENNGTLDELYQKCDEVLAKIKADKR